MQTMNRVFLGLGSNRGDREQFLRQAVSDLQKGISDMAIVGISDVYETQAVGEIKQNHFFNAVVEVKTHLTVPALWEVAEKVESQAGREPKALRQRWGPRTLDIDILFYGNQVVQEAQGMIIPHPRAWERWFVIKPMCDLDEMFCHPLLGVTMKQRLVQIEKEHPELIGKKVQGVWNVQK